MRLVKSVSAGLLMGAASIALLSAGPAAAAKKQQTAEAPAGQQAPDYKLSKEYREVAQKVLDALKANDYATAQTQLAALEPLSQQPDEKYVTADMRSQLASATKNEAMQQQAINEMLTSGSAAAQPNLPKLNYLAGYYAYQKKDYPKAIQLLGQAKQLGYNENGILLLLSDSYYKSGNVQQALQLADQAIEAEKAAGRKAPEDWYKRGAAMATKANLQPQSTEWLGKWIGAYPNKETWRTALLIYSSNNQPLDDQSKLDLFRLMRATGALSGQSDYGEYANIANARGLPGEAKAVIDEGRQNGALTSTSLADIYKLASGKVAADKSSLASSEKAAQSAANGKTAMATADAYLGYGDNAKAAALYQTALQKGGVDANSANMRLGIALARQGQGDAAKQAFAKVTGKQQQLAQFWTVWTDNRNAAA